MRFFIALEIRCWILKYTIKNLKYMIQNNRIVFILLILCILISTLVIQFSYGLYQNYHVIIEEGNSEYKVIELELENSADHYVTKGMGVDCIKRFSSNLYKNIDFCILLHDEFGFIDTYPNVQQKFEEVEGRMFLTYDESEGFRFSVSFDENGQFINSKTLQGYIESGSMDAGRYYTDAEYENAEKVCIVGLCNGVQRRGPFTGYNIEHKGMIEKEYFTDLYGEKYKIIGIGTGATDIPINAARDEYRIDIFYMEMKSTMTREQYEEFKTILTEELGEFVTLPELEIEPSKQIYLYKTIIIISILIALAAAINYAILYQFILYKRQRILAVLRMCGCTKANSVCIYLGECIIMTIPIFIVGTLLYDKVVMPFFADLYPFMESAFNIQVYAVLGLIYSGVMFLVTGIMIFHNINKNSIVASEKRGNEI